MRNWPIDLAAGQIKVGFVGTGGVIEHIRAGRLKGLAISSRQALAGRTGDSDDCRSRI